MSPEKMKGNAARRLIRRREFLEDARKAVGLAALPGRRIVLANLHVDGGKRRSAVRMEYVYEKRRSAGRDADGWFPARIGTLRWGAGKGRLKFYAFAFHNGDVPVDRKFRKHFHAAAGLRPANLKTVDF